jgi:hypothetical protein
MPPAGWLSAAPAAALSLSADGYLVPISALPL